MRAPSIDLLRALRCAATSSARIQALTPRRCNHHFSPCTRSSSSVHLNRRFTTSTGYLSPSPPPSRAHPPSTPPSTAQGRRSSNPYAPSPSASRGPTSKEETQTDFASMDIYASAGVVEPATSIDATTPDGFHLNNGVVTSGHRGVMLLGGEGFVWSPWTSRVGDGSSGSIDPTTTPVSREGARAAHPFSPFLNPRTSLFSFPPETLSLLRLLLPKPDLLIFGTGARLHMLSPATRAFLQEEMGIKVDVMDTANAAASYNLLVMERGVEGVGAILVPRGFCGR